MTGNSDQRTDNAVAVLAPSALRRRLGIGGLAGLGVILAYVAATGRESALAAAALAVAAALALVLAYRMKTATSSALELRSDGLYTTEGILVAAISNVERIELGMFAFKPSNGFLIILKQPMPGSWNPGLWWRVGRRVGVGGVTSRSRSKALAEAMAMLVREDSRNSR